MQKDTARTPGERAALEAARKQLVREQRAVNLRRFLSNRLSVVGLCIVTLMLLTALLAPVVTGAMGLDPYSAVVRDRLKPPSAVHPFGTDNLGRDIFARVLYGARISMTIGLVVGLLSAVIGTTLGILAARHEGSAYDTITSVTTYTMNSVPSFWLGLMFIILFSTKLGWLPSYGMTTARKNYEGWAYVVDVMRHMALPILTLTMVTMPKYFRTAKSSVLQVMNEDFITTLRATGMSEKKIFSKYVFRNAILPTITIFGITMAYLITGVSLIEVVFSWPGMGRLVLTAINQRDYPTLQGIYLIMSVSIAVVMILVDIIYAVFDPRIRYD